MSRLMEMAREPEDRQSFVSHILQPEEAELGRCRVCHMSDWEMRGSARSSYSAG